MKGNIYRILVKLYFLFVFFVFYFLRLIFEYRSKEMPVTRKMGKGKI